MRNVLVILLIVTLTGCFNTDNSFSNDDGLAGAGNELFAGSSPSFAPFRQILAQECASCHGAFLRFSQNDWIAQGLIIPGKPDESRLFRKLRGSGVGGDENMPPNASLNRDSIDLIAQWIRETAEAGASSPSLDRFTAALSVFTSRCTTCHTVNRTAVSSSYSGATVPQFVKFTTENYFITAGLVTPGHSADSWIFRVLRSPVGDPVHDIGTMPKNATLTEGEITVIRDWIDGIL